MCVNINATIFSGIVGALFGSGITVFLYWHSRYSSAKNILYNRISILRYEVHWNCKDSDVFKFWNPSLLELMPMYNDIVRVSCPIQRRRIRNAWQEYKGEKNNNNEIISCPKNKEEFIHKIDSFLKVL